VSELDHDNNFNFIAMESRPLVSAIAIYCLFPLIFVAFISSVTFLFAIALRLAVLVPGKPGPSPHYPFQAVLSIRSTHTYVYKQKLEMSTSVHAAAQNNQLSLLRSLVSEDATCVNSVDADTRTPLHWAASGGHLDVVSYLLANGAEVNKADDSGWTPLHGAVSSGHEDVVRELVGAGADVERKNGMGLTPLHYAASKSRIEIGRFLISHGADINARDKANQHPLHRAATTGSIGFVTLLLHTPEGHPKTRLNTGDRIGNTPLHLAMESAHGETAALLIEAGADRSRVNLEDQTAEQLDGVGGVEQRRARAYVIDRCGPPP